MARYDQTWARLAQRAVETGGTSIRTLVQGLVENDVSLERAEQMMREDLQNDGPVFGAFIRQLSGAAASSVMTAARQGEAVGAIKGDKELMRLTRLAEMDGSVIRALESADPEAAAELESEILNEQSYTWIAELRNTCHRCLPLHGRTLKLIEWKQLGLHPDTIHQGWDSPCYCRLVLASQVDGRAELLAPLRRVADKSTKGMPKGMKTTLRRVAQADIEKARQVAMEALGSKEGEATLRLLGKSARP